MHQYSETGQEHHSGRRSTPMCMTPRYKHSRLQVCHTVSIIHDRLLFDEWKIVLD
jgi:hypothetical protein